MRWNAMCITTSLWLLTVGLGCQSAQQKRLALDKGFNPVDTYIPPQMTHAAQPDIYPTYGEAESMDRTYDSPLTTSIASAIPLIAGPRYHTVSKRDTLYALARAYYGDHHRWRDIYEANRTTLADPNRIRVGQKLLIP